MSGQYRSAKCSTIVSRDVRKIQVYKSVIRFTGSSVFRKSFTFQNLVVHFELYDLEPDEEGIANFEVEYELLPVSRFLFWDRTGDHHDFSLTLNFSLDRPRFAESLEIETPVPEPGRYELIWRVRDLNSGHEVQQELRLEIVEME